MGSRTSTPWSEVSHHSVNLRRVGDRRHKKRAFVRSVLTVCHHAIGNEHELEIEAR